MNKNSSVLMSALCTLVLVTLSACGGSEDSVSKDLPGNGPTGRYGALPSAGAIQSYVAKVAGTWFSKCEQLGQQYGKGTLTFGVDHQNRVNFTRAYFSDAGCQKAIYQMTVIYNVKQDGTETASMADLLPTLVYVDVAFNQPQIITAANQGKLCGQTDWALNVSKSIKNLPCDGMSFESKPSDRITVSDGRNNTIDVKAPGKEEPYINYHR